MSHRPTKAPGWPDLAGAICWRALDNATGSLNKRHHGDYSRQEADAHAGRTRGAVLPHLFAASGFGAEVARHHRHPSRRCLGAASLGLSRALNNAAIATLIAAATAGKALVDDDCAKKAVAELTRD